MLVILIAQVVKVNDSGLESVVYLRYSIAHKPPQVLELHVGYLLQGLHYTPKSLTVLEFILKSQLSVID